MSSPARTARCGSSSWATSAPKNASIASLMSRATVPSYRSIGAVKYWKASFIISAHSSGSSCSAMAVEPATSQNSTITVRRSPCMARLERPGPVVSGG